MVFNLSSKISKLTLSFYKMQTMETFHVTEEIFVKHSSVNKLHTQNNVYEHVCYYIYKRVSLNASYYCLIRDLEACHSYRIIHSLKVDIHLIIYA